MRRRAGGCRSGACVARATESADRLAVESRTVIVVDVDDGIATGAALSWNELRDQAKLAAQSFRQVCRALSVTSYEAVVDEADKAPSLVRHAHCSDLTVLSQADPGTPGHSLDRALVEPVVLYRSRPTLILPYAGQLDTLCSHAMVAWDDSREAARALPDALPLLRLATQVHAIT